MTHFHFISFFNFMRWAQLIHMFNGCRTSYFYYRVDVQITISWGWIKISAPSPSLIGTPTCAVIRDGNWEPVPNCLFHQNRMPLRLSISFWMPVCLFDSCALQIPVCNDIKLKLQQEIVKAERRLWINCSEIMFNLAMRLARLRLLHT